jgi:hypothetical protein
VVGGLKWWHIDRVRWFWSTAFVNRTVCFRAEGIFSRFYVVTF